MEKKYNNIQMNMEGNRYLTVRMKPEEIIRQKVEFDDKTIEEIEYKEKSNVLIYKNEIENELSKINRTVEILITTQKTINNNKYRDIPKTVRTIIINNEMYKNTEESELTYFMSKETLEEYIRSNIIPNKRYNKSNSNSHTILYVAIYKKLDEELIEELINMMDRTIINKPDLTGETVLHWCVYNRMERTFDNLMNKMTEEAINRVDIYNQTALYYACMRNMENMAIRLIEKSNKTVVNMDVDGKTALYWACIRRMETVAKELVKRMSYMSIEMRDEEDNTTALDYAEMNEMEEVVEMIKDKI
jgi:ankyrin repeat protein